MKPIHSVKSLYSKAQKIASSTPKERNRYVDFLRLMAISVVVLAHWLMASPYFIASENSAHMAHLLDSQPWSQWLTWLFQVMPIFFFVGGYSNSISWASSLNKNQAYANWLEARMRRLLGSAIPLVALWAVLGTIGYFLGVSKAAIQMGSQISLVPVWFLAIYFVIVLLVPVTQKLWQRFGFLSIVIPLILAMFLDWLFFTTDLKQLAWFNYLLIWGSIHQLGYAWQEGKLANSNLAWVLFIGGLASLILITQIGPYPTSLVGVPGQELSNTTPPKLPLLALGLAQIGLLLLLEKPMRKWLSNGNVWAVTVLCSGFIMPIFIWHSTVMVLLIGFVFEAMPMIFNATPGSPEWWSQRPLWIGVYSIFMLMCLPILMRLEKITNGECSESTRLIPLAVGGLLIGSGLALLANGGVTGTQLWNLNWMAICLPLLGAGLVSFASRN